MILICYHYVCSQIEDSSRIASLEDVSIRNSYWLINVFSPKKVTCTEIKSNAHKQHQLFT